MEILIKIDAESMMYHTYIDCELYDARDGFKNIEDIVSDAVTTFLYDPDVDYSSGFKVEFA